MIRVGTGQLITRAGAVGATGHTPDGHEIITRGTGGQGNSLLINGARQGREWQPGAGLQTAASFLKFSGQSFSWAKAHVDTCGL